MKPISAILTVMALGIATVIAASCTPARAHAATTPPVAGSVSLDVAYVQQVKEHREHREHRHHFDMAAAALAWARSQGGKPYEWGETGPNGYDCSGLVYAAYHHWKAGRKLGRDTYDMLAQVGTVLKRVRHPQPGDLAFYGTGHVELWLGRLIHRHKHWFTFGAQQPGTNVGPHRIWWGSWQPTAYYEVV